MKIFAISDLHLSKAVEKPMDVFGDGWDNHFAKISQNWLQSVSEGDVVLLGGDMSWGMTIEEALPDYEDVAALPGIKVVVKGNHDYYWNSLNKMRQNFKGFHFVQNNALRIDSDGNVAEYFDSLDRRSKKQTPPAISGKGIVIAGSRGWTLAKDSVEEADKKIYANELSRLKTSLSAARGCMQEGDLLIALLHYPPFDAEYHDSEVTALLEEYGVKYALYGHLHGKNARVTPRLQKHGITYLLTSCDLISNKLIEVAQI